MLNQAKDYLRRHVRAAQRARQFPVRLPHHEVTATGLRSVDGTDRPLPSSLRSALTLADGTRTLREIARASRIAPADLIRAQDDGLLLIWREPVPAEPPKATHAPHSIIVSPHLDDAALSCGGRMLGDQSTLVLNVFSRSTWWRFDGAPGDVDTILACRRAEETLVSRLSGEPMTNLDLPEALLRGHAMADVFTAKADARDEDVSARIEASVSSLAHEHRLAHWFLPLGVGDHIDHRLARDAASAALDRAGVKPTHLHFYEDLPYAAKLGPDADFAHHLPGRTLVEETLEIDDDLPWKIELLRAYWSQFRWSQVAEIGAYARAAGNAEVTWRPA
jgi:LmbE family N-acetylglucosaminyl deacetylase